MLYDGIHLFEHFLHDYRIEPGHTIVAEWDSPETGQALHVEINAYQNLEDYCLQPLGDLEFLVKPGVCVISLFVGFDMSFVERC